MQIRFSTLRRPLLAAAVLLSCAAGTGHAQTVISSLPYTITTGGSYVLNANLISTATTGNLITINASNVTLDMQDHFIAGPSNTPASTLMGIYANEKSNVTIKNGTIAFCYEGVFLLGNNTATTNAVDARVENLRVTYCYYTGIDMNYLPSSRVVNCQVSQIGGSTATANDTVGINAVGEGITIQGNAVSNVKAPTGGSSYCIFSDTGNFARSNQVSHASFGIDFGLYQDNLAHACTTPFSDGTDGGGNVND